MIKILHTADLHIGDRRFGKFDPARSQYTRLDDQFKILMFLADLAFKEGVGAAILAGDIYHGRTPTPAEEDIFAEFVARLTGEGVHVFAIAGNHERPAIPGKASPLTHIATLGLPRFHLLDKPSVRVVEIDGEKLAVAAIPWPHRRDLIDSGLVESGGSFQPEIWDRYIDDEIKKLAERIPGDAKAVLVSHLWTANVRGYGLNQIRGEPICRAETLARAPFDYIALGHIHRHQAVWPEPPVIYSGSIERTDFSEVDVPKGVVVVEFGEKADWRFVDVPARRFVAIEMDLSGMPDPVESAAIKANASNIEGAVVRITITQAKGDPPIDARRLRPKLSAPYYLRVIRREVEDDSRPIALRSYDPIEALGEYIDRSDEMRGDKKNLIELARKLAEEARGG